MQSNAPILDRLVEIVHATTPFEASIEGNGEGTKGKRSIGMARTADIQSGDLLVQVVNVACRRIL